jgi:hypothetical protein
VIPRVQVQLVVGVDPARRRRAQVQRRAAVAADVAHPRQQVGDDRPLRAPLLDPVAEPGGDEGLRQ